MTTHTSTEIPQPSETLWQDFLMSVPKHAAQTEINDAAAGHILVDLSHRGLLKLDGEDAISFLQGQVTNDVKLLDGAHSHYTGYCNPKGRLLALFFAFAHNHQIYLEFDKTILEAVMKRLKMYVLRSKVVISEATDLVRIGVAGTNTIENLTALFLNIPQNAHETLQFGDTTLIRLPSQIPMFEIITSAQETIKIWKALENTHIAVSKTAWDWLEIQAGIPEIVAATQEAFVPQMLNLDVLDGINFKKGCYTGQEIVARTHYLGKVKRRTQLAHIASEDSPSAGDAVFDEAQQSVGQIVRVSPAPHGGFDVLAECRLESVEQSSLFWRDQPLMIKPLPYTLI